VTYPILMKGSAAGIPAAYACTYDYLFVIGGDGIVIWRGNYNDAAIRDAIDQGLESLVSPTPVIPFGENLLLPNYPNPFNPLTRIPFELALGDGDIPVTLQILDLRGRIVSTLIDDRFHQPGRRYEVTWDGTDNAGRRQPSGIYFVQLHAGATDRIRTLTLVK